MDTLLDRFLRYVKIDTQSDETSNSIPSTTKQFELCDLLRDECRDLKLENVSRNADGIMMATIPATVRHSAPTIVWLAHVDTSPEYTAHNVRPVVHRNYTGSDIALAGAPAQVIRVALNPELAKLKGKTIITTDGTTLLGADDKSGIAVIMSAAAYLMQHPEIEHGPVRICFTCDEEIGRGVDRIDMEELGGVCGYTLDGEGVGRIDGETFSADQAVVTVTGVNTHPSVGKNVMVNALRILSAFIDRLPADRLSPETTSGRDGFLHPYRLEGGVAQAQARIILRDFETAELQDYAALLEQIAEQLRAEHPQATIEIDVHEQYRNMRDGLEKEPRAVAKALEAMRAAGLEPLETIIRGGTDGAQLTQRGLPTPNLSTGQHNPHSPQEWTCLEEMETAVAVLVQLAVAWGRETQSGRWTTS